jgi:hypothetical protein
VGGKRRKLKQAINFTNNNCCEVYQKHQHTFEQNINRKAISIKTLGHSRNRKANSEMHWQRLNGFIGVWI